MKLLDTPGIKLGTLGVFLKGQGIRRDDVQSSGVPCLRYGEIYTRFGDYTNKLVSHVSIEVADTAIRLQTGDIIFAGSGETKAEIGKCTAWIGDGDAVVGGDTIILRRHGQDPIYLASLLNAASSAKQKAARGQGDAVVHISARALGDIDIRLPLRPTQERVSAKICDTDSLVRSLDQMLAKKRAIKQGMMQQLLTCKTRLPGFTTEWISGPLGAFMPLQRGFDLPSSRLLPGKYPVVYSNGASQTHAKAMVKGPGVVTGRSGTIGKVHYVESDYWPHNTALWITSFARVEAKFAYYFLTYLGLERFASGSGVPTFNRNDAHSFEIRLPSEPKEQSAIAGVLSTIDAEISALEMQKKKAQAIKEGMLQRLLTNPT